MQRNGKTICNFNSSYSEYNSVTLKSVGIQTSFVIVGGPKRCIICGINLVLSLNLTRGHDSPGVAHLSIEDCVV